MIYGIIKYEHFFLRGDWYADPSTIEVFHNEEERDKRLEELNSKISKCDCDYWDDFEAEIQ